MATKTQTPAPSAPSTWDEATPLPPPVWGVSQLTFRVSATIPTGNYENIQPMIEMVIDVPEGATPPNNDVMVASLQHQLALGVIPSILQITSLINITPYLKDADPTKAVSLAYLNACPPFKWLSTVDRDLARSVVIDAINEARKDHDPLGNLDANEYSGYPHHPEGKY